MNLLGLYVFVNHCTVIYIYLYMPNPHTVADRAELAWTSKNGPECFVEINKNENK